MSAALCASWPKMAGLASTPAFSYNNQVMQIGRRAGVSNGEESRRWSPRNHFANEMDAYAEALRAGHEPLTPGEEGLQDQRIMARDL